MNSMKRQINYTSNFPKSTEEKNCGTEKIFEDRSDNSTNLAEDIRLQIQKEEQSLNKTEINSETNNYQTADN